MRTDPFRNSEKARRKRTVLGHTTGVVRKLARRMGYDVVRRSESNSEYPPDFTADVTSIIRVAQPYTMTSPERLYSLLDAVRYVTSNQIVGAIVECGVWRGGSMMAAALMLQQLKSTDRNLYLFDTFEGMPKPAGVDTSYNGTNANAIFEALKIDEDSSDYCRANLDEVREAISSTKYPMSRVHFIKGKVEATIPEHAPENIAILRLDTDWYDSTKHELYHLYPRLSPGGALIVDDYGHWQGCKKAVDEYFEGAKPGIFLARIDYTGRIGIKPA